MKLHVAGGAYAKSLIAAAKVDLASTFAAPESPAASDNMHLGVENDAPTFVFGKDGQVYRAALRDVVKTAFAQGHTEIVATARELLNIIDNQMVQGVLDKRPAAPRRAKATNTTPRQWYRIQASAPAGGDTASSSADIYIYDDIGEYLDWGEGGIVERGVSATNFIDELKQLPGTVATIRVHINCRGGDVFDAIAIANALRQHRAEKVVMIEGLCASAATIVSCAGDTIQMADNALMMVHRPETFAYGSEEVLRERADALGRIGTAIVATYRWVSQLSADALSELMANETWMGAAEALANGFITDIVSGLKATAALDRRVVNSLRVPAPFRARFEALLEPDTNAAAPAEDVMRLCREAGCLDIAEGLVTAKATPAVVTARIEQAKVDQRAAATRVSDITALCANAKLPELVSGYVASNMSLEDVRTHLLVIDARMNGAELDTKLRATHVAPATSATATAANTYSIAADIYAERNASRRRRSDVSDLTSPSFHPDPCLLRAVARLPHDAGARDREGLPCVPRHRTRAVLAADGGLHCRRARTAAHPRVQIPVAAACPVRRRANAHAVRTVRRHARRHRLRAACARRADGGAVHARRADGRSARRRVHHRRAAGWRQSRERDRPVRAEPEGRRGRRARLPRRRSRLRPGRRGDGQRHGEPGLRRAGCAGRQLRREVHGARGQRRHVLGDRSGRQPAAELRHGGRIRPGRRSPIAAATSTSR
jgi:ATP-dependent Clp protease protease subunit